MGMEPVSSPSAYRSRSSVAGHHRLPREGSLRGACEGLSRRHRKCARARYAQDADVALVRAFDLILLKEELVPLACSLLTSTAGRHLRIHLLSELVRADHRAGADKRPITNRAAMAIVTLAVD
jgi:hypothetical protein